MVNIATLFLTHGLLLAMAWRLLFRDDLDRDPPTDGGGAKQNGEAGDA